MIILVAIFAVAAADAAVSIPLHYSCGLSPFMHTFPFFPQ